MFQQTVRPFKSSVDARSDDFKEKYNSMMTLVHELEENLKESLWQGKESHIKRHLKAGRLLGLLKYYLNVIFFLFIYSILARDRIELLLDEDSPFLELLPLAGFGQDNSTAGASLVAGIGLVCGVECIITANVNTIKGGSVNEATLLKSSRLAEISIENRLPTISLIQSV